MVTSRFRQIPTSSQQNPPRENNQRRSSDVVVGGATRQIAAVAAAMSRRVSIGSFATQRIIIEISCLLFLQLGSKVIAIMGVVQGLTNCMSVGTAG